MTLHRDKLVVVDIEATCWKNYENPPGIPSEIIEIGVCLLDLDTLEPKRKRSILVQPVKSYVSPFCTQLTSLTQEQVERGHPFADACQILETEYATKNRLWLSWGDYDRKLFVQQCKDMHVAYPFGEKHINFKRLFADLQGQRLGLSRAFRVLHLSMEGRHHRGDDDAWNTAILLRHVLEKHGDGILGKYW